MYTAEVPALAVVSHELRTPLTAVLAYAHLLGSGRLDAARTSSAIDTIQRNAKAMRRIIDDLLDRSGPLAGAVRLDATPVDLVAVVRDALDDVRPTADAGRLHLTLTCCSAPAVVAGDALRLQQVVTNLLSNAIKFTPPGGLIDVQVDAQASGVALRVSDTGQGISAEFLPRIFEEFAQADDPAGNRHGGIGLGLAVVRALVECHGGTVQAESEGLGKGATFTVRLPALGPRSNGRREGPSPIVR